MLKQVVIIREDLNLPVYKLMTQISKATLKIFTNRIRIKSQHNHMKDFLDLNTGVEGKIYLTERMRLWIQDSFAKAIFSVNGDAELNLIYEKVKTTNIPVYLMKDNNVTTCLAVGPDHINRIKETIGNLKCLEENL